MDTTDNELSHFIDTPAQEAPDTDDATEDTSEAEADTTEAQDVDSEAAAEADDSVQDAEQDDQNTDEAEADEQPTFTVKVDGEDRVVTLDELTQSFAGQGYIQKRMQENAETKRQVETVFQSLVQERAQLAHLVEQVRTGNMLVEPKEPDPAIGQRDPIAFNRAWQDYRNAKAAFDQQQAEINAYTQQQTETQQRALAAYQAEQMRELAARLPDFADPQKGTVLARQLTETAQTYGFAPEELGQVNDHRALLILHDAMKYRNLQEQREKAAKKAEQARPITKPGAQKPADTGRKKAAEAARAKMKQTGDISDWLLTPSR